MQTVRIRLRKPTRVFTFLCSGIPLRRDEACIVRSDRGLEYGTCVVPPEPCPDGMRNRLKMSVVRRASDSDERTYAEMQVDEARARDMCLEKVRARNLHMKLVDVEYTFDKSKVIFYFTAGERVDFRELVRDLAQELRTRIELRHIQVRDEAKLVGGIGVCGRELCCATWMHEFKPISMKMAKLQNLSLNPTKISGQCGRLLCCLEYENLHYKEERENQKRARREAEEAAAARAKEDKERAAAGAEPAAPGSDGAWLKKLEQADQADMDGAKAVAPDTLDDKEAQPSEVVKITAEEGQEGASPQPDKPAEEGARQGRKPRRRGGRRRRGRRRKPEGGSSSNATS